MIVFSFVYLAFRERVGTVSHQINLGVGGIELFHFVGSKPHGSRTEEVIQMVGVGRAGYWGNPRFAREHPYQGELCRGHIFSFRPFLHEIHQRHIVLQRFRLELRQVPAAVAFLETAVLVDSSREERTTQRTIRNEADS